MKGVDDLRRAGGKQRVSGGREGKRVQHTVAAGVEARQRAAVGRAVKDDDAARADDVRQDVRRQADEQRLVRRRLARRRFGRQRC
mgnify:CR=1 FL=1